MPAVLVAVHVPTVTQNLLHPLSTSSITAHHLLDFMLHGKITEITHQQSVWTPSHPFDRCPHLHYPPHFYAEALSAAILPSYPGLGQAPNNAGLHMISSLVKKQARYIKQMQKIAP